MLARPADRSKKTGRVARPKNNTHAAAAQDADATDLDVSDLSDEADDDATIITLADVLSRATPGTP